MIEEMCESAAENGYAAFSEAPPHHRRVAALAFQGHSVREIVRAMRLRTKTVERILAIPVIEDWVRNQEVDVLLDQFSVIEAITAIRIESLREIQKRLPSMRTDDLIKAMNAALKSHPDGLTASQKKTSVDHRVTVMHEEGIRLVKEAAHGLGLIPEITHDVKAEPIEAIADESADKKDDTLDDFQKYVLEEGLL